MAGYCFGKIYILRFELKESREGLLSERKGRDVPVEGLKKKKA